MEDDRIVALMKYVRGEISFSEWIESGAGSADVEDENETQDGNGDDQGDGEAGGLQSTEVNTLSEERSEPTDVATTTSNQEMVILVSEPIFTQLSEMGSQALALSSATESPVRDSGKPNNISSSLQQTATAQPPIRMTDLLLQGSAAKSAQKPGGTGVDEFMEEIKQLRAPRRRAARRKLCELPAKHKHTMGHVNMLWARGEMEKAKGICMDLIRQVPKCSEPFQTLGMMFEEQGDKEKALQFFLIAAYLSKSGDSEEWAKLAMMSVEQNNLNQALTCYNQALKVDPGNANILWDRAALYYQMDNPKKSLESYEMACQAMSLNFDDGAKYMDLVCEMAKLHHENKNLEEAVKVLQAAFSQYPEHFNNQATNMLADLLMASKAYEEALQIILKHCGARKEANTEPTNESPLTAFSLLLSPTRQASTARSPQRDNSEAPVNLVLPQDLPIDLRVKIVVCLIYLRQLDLVKKILHPLFFQSVETVGDLYMDVAEACAENGDYDEALPILDILIRSKNYNMAGVWLKKGECLHSLGRLDEAAFAYAQVVNLAPNHLDARLILASLHQQLGRPNQALDILSDPRGIEIPQDASSREVSMDATHSPAYTEESDSEPAVQPQDFRLLYHKCALLQSQDRVDEFVEAGIELFKLFFNDVYHNKDLMDIALRSAKYRRAEAKKNEPSDQEGTNLKPPSHTRSKGNTGIRNEEWWEMLKKVVSSLSHLKRHADTQHLLLCALSSDRFSNSNFQTGLLFMSVVALYLNREYKLAFDTVKILIARDRHKPLYWNLMARITAKSGDTRHQRYILRLLIKHPDELPLVLYSGHNAAVSASYKFAIGEYIRAFRQTPLDPLVTLCLGLQYLHLASQRFPRHRHTCVIQSIVFMFQYLGLRGECQEAFYNLGRAFHQLGLLQFAVHYYHKALEFPLHEASLGDGQTAAKFSGKHDLHRETAFNLSLIYRASGNELIARELLRKHCCI